MQQFLEQLTRAYKSIEPDATLERTVLERAKNMAADASSERSGFQSWCVSRRFFIAGAAACLVAVSVGFATLRPRGALASTRLENASVTLTGQFWTCATIEDGAVVMRLDADFSCVDESDECVTVGAHGPIGLARGQDEAVQVLVLEAGESKRGSIVIRTNQNEQLIREFWKGEEDAQYRILYDCLANLEKNALLTVESQGKSATTYGFGLSSVDGWQDVQQRAESGLPLVIRLIAQ